MTGASPPATGLLPPVESVSAVSPLRAAIPCAIAELDRLVRDEARRVHAENVRHGSAEYRQIALRGGYDLQEELVALRAAIRRGLEIGRAL